MICGRSKGFLSPKQATENESSRLKNEELFSPFLFEKKVSDFREGLLPEDEGEDEEGRRGGGGAVATAAAATSRLPRTGRIKKNVFSGFEDKFSFSFTPTGPLGATVGDSWEGSVNSAAPGQAPRHAFAQDKNWHRAEAAGRRRNG